MRKHNPENERIKHKYLIFLKEARRQDDASTDAVAKALIRFEEYTSFKNFKTFRFEQAVGFKKHLAKQANQQTGKKLSKATLNSTLRHLKVFFQWLYSQAGYKSRICYNDTEYFNLSEKETRIATAKRQKPVPTIEQINKVIKVMPNSTDIERRNRCLIAFTLLTGARDSAIASLKIKHVDIDAGSLFQDAREVNTKYSKTFTTTFFPVGNEMLQIVVEWINYLKGELLYGNDDPLFPKTNVIQGKNRTYEVSGFKREHWSNASPIRKVFKEAFDNAGLPYFNPHSFRSTLVMLGEKLCKNAEEFKSWSQNLGHQGVLTTFYSYGEVQPQRQAEIIKQLKSPLKKAELSVDNIAEAVIRKMKSQY
ncbi:MAG: recombinase XerC [Gammaproteobacteria bacterium]|nr:MAG: recombinase XerC [Gammaproteobacteria bacterium]